MEAGTWRQGDSRWAWAGGPGGGGGGGGARPLLMQSCAQGPSAGGWGPGLDTRAGRARPGGRKEGHGVLPPAPLLPKSTNRHTYSPPAAGYES